MLTGFKGTSVQIARISVQEEKVSFEVHFRAPDDGPVHALVKHEIPFAESKSIAEHVKGLVTALKDWAEKTHFTGGFADEVSKQGTANGIAEAIHRSRDDIPPARGVDQGGE